MTLLVSSILSQSSSPTGSHGCHCCPQSSSPRGHSLQIATMTKKIIREGHLLEMEKTMPSSPSLLLSLRGTLALQICFTNLVITTVLNSAILLARWAAIASYLPERTDNDIKNYWNTHLKRKLKKGGAAGESGGPDAAAATAGLRSRTSTPKGQWERRLQTDIDTARQALRDALSPDTPATPTGPQTPALAAPPSKATYAYASSADNIARLLEGWMRPGEGGGSKASSGGSRSSGSVSGDGEGAAPTPEGSTVTSKTEDAAAPALSMLENWLFDDGMGHGGVGLMDVPLGDPSQFF